MAINDSIVNFLYTLWPRLPQLARIRKKITIRQSSTTRSTSLQQFIYVMLDNIYLEITITNSISRERLKIKEFHLMNLRRGFISCDAKPYTTSVLANFIRMVLTANCDSCSWIPASPRRFCSQLLEGNSLSTTHRHYRSPTPSSNHRRSQRGGLGGLGPPSSWCKKISIVNCAHTICSLTDITLFSFYLNKTDILLWFYVASSTHQLI